MHRTLDLPCRLTEAELIDRGQSLAATREQYRDVQQAAKDAAKEFRDRLATIEAELDRLAEIVRERHEPRPVRCELRPDYQRGVVDTVRLDTGEVASSRALTEAERQGWLPGAQSEAARELAVAVERFTDLPEGVDSMTITTPGQEPVVIENKRQRRH